MLQQSCIVLLDKASGFNGVDRCNTCYQFVISFLYWQFFIFFSANHLQILGFFFGFVGLLIANQFVLLVYRSQWGFRWVLFGLWRDKYSLLSKFQVYCVCMHVTFQLAVYFLWKLNQFFFFFSLLHWESNSHHRWLNWV